MTCKEGQFDVVELIVNIKEFSIKFAKNLPLKIGLEEIEKL